MRTKTKAKAVRDARYALTFGLEAAAVRLGPCVAMRNFDGPDKRIRCRVRQAVIDDELQLVWDPAHVQSVGAGGTRMDLVRLCSAHHGQQHDIGIESFGELYGLDLRAHADEQALAHEPPLGIRGLAARWAASKVVPRVFDSKLLRSPVGAGDGTTSASPPLVGYDLAALMAWTRRRMGGETWALLADPDEGEAREVFAQYIAAELDGEFSEDDGSLAWALCERAGWPGVQDGRGVR